MNCTSGDLGALVERVEDALVQADEVDGRMLQFEGGLSVTSVVLTGAAALTKKAAKNINKKKPMNLCRRKRLPSNQVISSPFSHRTFFSQNFVKVPCIFNLVESSRKKWFRC